MQVLLVVVLFILLFSMVPLFDLSASFSIVLLFQSSSMPSSTISSSGVKFPQWVGCTVIRQKKNNLLYKDITCLYHSHAQLWVLCLVVLFMLVLRLAPLCVGFLFRLFRRPSSFRFCCCRHIVGLLLIASDLDFPWGLLFYQVLFIVVLFILFFSLVPYL